MAAGGARGKVFAALEEIRRASSRDGDVPGMSGPNAGRSFKAFSSEVDTGSCEENASKQEIRASVLIQSKPILL